MAWLRLLFPVFIAKIRTWCVRERRPTDASASAAASADGAQRLIHVRTATPQKRASGFGAPIKSAPVCAVSRAPSACRATPSRAGSKKVAALPPLRETLRPVMPNTPCQLEWDELWSFVPSKAETAWVWSALDRETRPVVAYCLGNRSAESCRYLWEQVPAPWREAVCYTDFGEA